MTHKELVRREVNACRSAEMYRFKEYLTEDDEIRLKFIPLFAVYDRLADRVLFSSPDSSACRDFLIQMRKYRDSALLPTSLFIVRYKFDR